VEREGPHHRWGWNLILILDHGPDLRRQATDRYTLFLLLLIILIVVIIVFIVLLRRALTALPVSELLLLFLGLICLLSLLLQLHHLGRGTISSLPDHVFRQRCFGVLDDKAGL
jgi:predicted neutral ceramidase superfamily lipid hydrolase